MKINIELPEKIFGVNSTLIIIYVPIFILAILIIVTTNLVIVPKIEDTIIAINNISDINSQKNKVIEKTRYLQSVDQEEMKNNSDAINSALLPQKNAYLLVGIVRNISSSFGYQIDSFTVNPGVLSKDDSKKSTKVVEGVSKIPVKIVLVGPLNKYLDLIRGMESSLPILSLDTFKMKNDSQTAMLDIVISSYYIEGNAKFDVNKLSLNDLTLTKDESEILTKLTEFKSWGNTATNGIIPIQKEFTNYNRLDPFIP